MELNKIAGPVQPDEIPRKFKLEKNFIIPAECIGMGKLAPNL